MTSVAKSIGEYAKGVVDTIKETVAGTGKTVKGLIVFIVTTLLNQLGNKQFFKCPAENYECTGKIFLYVPGVIFAMLIFMASNGVSEGSILCCKDDESRRRERYRLWFFVKASGLAACYAFLAFLSWVVASLLFTETYSCMKLGPTPNTKNATILATYKINKEIKNAESITKGLLALLIALCVLMALFFLNKCVFSKLSEITNRLKDEECYDECEAKAAKKAFDKLVEVSGKYNGEKYVDKLIPVEYAKKEPQPKNKQEQDPGSEPKDSDPKKDSKPKNAEPQDDAEAETDYEAVPLPKADLLKLRETLIKRYPRLDNPLDWTLEYMDKSNPKPANGAGDRSEGRKGKTEGTSDDPDGAGEELAFLPKET